MADHKHKDHQLDLRLDVDRFQPPDGFKPGSGHHGHQNSFSSTRTAMHRGRKIKIRTTYRIEIDGEPLTLHTMVMNDGTVHCHGLPNYSFPSAIDLARSIIDSAGLVKIEDDELGHGQDPHAGSHHGSHNAHHGEDH